MPPRRRKAAAIDSAGRILGNAEFEACARGYRELLAWLHGHGTIQSVGIEGTGSYGAGLCRHLLAEGVKVIEVDRPDRRMRRARGKSDPIDAESAARAVLAGTARTTPKDRRGVVESIRMLRIARSGAVKARTAAINALRTTVATAPEQVRVPLDVLTPARLIGTCSALRSDRALPDDPLQGAKLALRTSARRIEAFDLEIRELDGVLARLVREVAPAAVSTHEGLCRAPHGRGAVQIGDHSLSETVPRARGLSCASDRPAGARGVDSI